MTFVVGIPGYNGSNFKKEKEYNLRVSKKNTPRAGVVKEVLIDTLHMDRDLPSFVSMEGHSGSSFEQGFWAESSRLLRMFLFLLISYLIV